MDATYVPADHPPCEPYWMSLLEEGPTSLGVVPGSWQWSEIPEISASVWEEARSLQAQHTPLSLPVDGYNRGGLIAHWNGVECFIPASHLVAYPFPADPIAREEQFKLYVGKELELCIIEVEPTRRRILLSERQVGGCEPEQPQWPSWLVEGATCEGEVTSIRPFGAFVDIGPLEGMIHISEISWGRVRHPGDFVKPGQKVSVIVLNVDPDNQRVGLSLKRLTANPWDSVENQLNPGDEMVGTVAGIERFGVFVELVQGLEGLLHISKLSNGQEDSPNLYRAYQVGESIKVRVLDLNPQEHRIALGLPDGAVPYGKA